MRIIVTGATGLVGAEVLRQAIKDSQIEEVIAIARNKPEVEDPKISFIKHDDFLNYSSLETYFKKADAILWCLGISQTQVSKQQYEAITYDYVMACANYCVTTKPTIRFIFVSGNGADRTEKSRTIFRRVKGKAENGLLQRGLKDLYIVRPDAIRPRHKNKRAPFLYKLAYPIFPVIAALTPNKIIWSDKLAVAMLKIAKSAYEKNTLENFELRALGELSI